MLICLATENKSAFAEEIEVDESYFGGHRKGKRGRGAAGKVPVFLKECEWRFNNPKPKSQLKLLKQLVKQYMG